MNVLQNPKSAIFLQNSDAIRSTTDVDVRSDTSNLEFFWDVERFLIDFNAFQMLSCKCILFIEIGILTFWRLGSGTGVTECSNSHLNLLFHFQMDFQCTSISFVWFLNINTADSSKASSLKYSMPLFVAWLTYIYSNTRNLEITIVHVTKHVETWSNFVPP